MTEEEKEDALVAEINGMSDDAKYIMSKEYFGSWIDGGDSNPKSVLMVTTNDRQEKVYAELAEHGMVWLDTERGEVGWRSSEKGRHAHYLF